MSDRFPRGLRDVLRRLLRRPPSDWAGPDTAAEALLQARMPEVDDRHEIVGLGDIPAGLEALLRGFEARGHRVFRIPAGESFEAVDRLRRERRLGATVALVTDPARIPLAERLRGERGWPFVDLSAGAEGLTEQTLGETLRRAFPLASIVIVTYGNRDLNRLCLESVFARTEWPRYEVLVVDNGSSDGTPELLAGLARAHETLRVIALPANRGYPAACNLGLAAAAGDPLVLLNNDTVVTRGWLTALRRHLTASRELGMVGPVTNAIANEARIEVGYEGLEELPRWASAWVSEHDGESVSIGMLAFFCVALRRAAFQDVGPLDERFGLGLFEDGDYNRRLRARGWEVRCVRDAFVHHWQNASFRRLGKEAYFALYEENRRKFEEKWRAPGKAD